MKILTVGNMYPPHHLGGYELTWWSSVHQLRAAGHDVAVLTTDFRRPDPDPGFTEDPRVRRELRWYWHDHDFPPIGLRERLLLERRNARVLARQIDELRPDAVCWWAMGGMSLSLIEHVRRAGLPAIGVVGDAWMVYGPERDAWTRGALRLGSAAAVVTALAGCPSPPRLAAVRWLFNSEAVRQDSRRSALAFGASELAFPGVNTDLFRARAPRDWTWDLLHVGRLDERKGVDTAIEALRLLPSEARLRIVGAGDDTYLAELRALCDRLGLAERVAFDRLPREGVPAAYEHADALLFPVRWEEPWGLVPLEAMAVGTPVVATGTGGSAEYLRHGANAVVVGPDPTPAVLAEAVRGLASDPALRDRVREGGHHTAARFTEQAYNHVIEAALVRAVA